MLLLLVAAAVTPKEACGLASSTFSACVRGLGYPVEEHTAVTGDGYKLRLFRIPGPRGSPVVLLQHGITLDAWCWVVNGEISAAFVLWKRGYDVWLTNNRGTPYSMGHTTLKPGSKEFWNFTFDDMGRYDVPANVEYTLAAAAADELTFVGHSQGTTQMFVAGLAVPELARKIRLFVALSPVVYVHHLTSAFLKPACTLHVPDGMYRVDPMGFLNTPAAISDFEKAMCDVTLGAVCKVSVDLICGVSKLDAVESIINLSAHFPRSTSMKDLVHFAQYVRDNAFARFDYGCEGNRREYGQCSPPVYSLANFPVPVALFAGDHDDLVAKEDLARTTRELGPIRFAKTYKGFSHVTWVVGTDVASQEWLTDLLGLLEQPRLIV